MSFGTHFLAIAGFVYTGERITARIKQRFLSAILRQNIGFFDGEGRDSLVSNLMSDSDIIREGISQKLSLTISAIGTLIGTLIVGFVLNARLTGIVIWSVIATFLLAAGANFVAITHGTKANDARTEFTNIVEQSLHAIKTVLALCAEKDVLRQFSRCNESAARSGFYLRSLVGCVMGFAVAIGYLSVALTFWQGSHLMSSATATFSQVVAIALLFKSAAFSVLGLGAHVEAFTRTGISLGKILSVIHRHPSAYKYLEETIPDVRFDGSIVFKDVRFIYPTRSSTVILDKINLTIESSKLTTIVGSSGSGKSSIVNLLLGFYPLVSGSLHIGKQDIRSCQLDMLRKLVRVVPQDPILFECSIHENVALGLLEADRERLSQDQQRAMVKTACQIAEIHEFISKQQGGYEARVGPRGENLSGGQRQRIALARALVSNPPILILDEATSALDIQTEAKVLENLRQWQANHTIINISHRLLAAKWSDTVVVLKSGQVIEQGSYDSLVNDGGYGAYFRSLTVQDNPQLDFLHTARPDTEHSSLHIDRMSISAMSFQKSVHTLTPLVNQATKTESAKNVRAEESISKSYRASRRVTAQFVWSMCRAEWIYIAVGALASIIASLEEPIAALLFAYAVVALSSLEDSQGTVNGPSIGLISWIFLALGLVQFLMFCIQAFSFAHSAEQMVMRVRTLVFRSFLSRNVAFYEEEQNSVAKLIRIVFDSSEAMTGFSGAILGATLTGSFTILAALSLGCALGWKLALVCGATIPLIVICGFWGISLVEHLKLQIEEYHTASARIGSEAIAGIKTVAAFGMEKDVLIRYGNSLSKATGKSLWSNLKLSAIYAVTQAILYLCMALGFWYGSRLIFSGEYTIFQVVVVYSSIITSAYSAGVIFSFATDLGKAKSAALTITQNLEQSVRKTEPQPRQATVLGERLELQDVYFAYPSRPNHYMLRSINLQASRGQHIAIVGESGSGKSTLLSLLARFHEQTLGRILLDGNPVSDIDLESFRQQVAIVSQESVLFQGTIFENLTLGLSEFLPSDAQIQKACTEAGVWDLIQSLPEALHTQVGSRGTTLSGGQRQRLSLARALLRNAKVLLLDEITSAVDLQTESLILAALEKIGQDRIVISVSHRPEMNKRADRIFVLRAGEICEEGNHESLIRQRGIYWAINGTSLPSGEETRNQLDRI